MSIRKAIIKLAHDEPELRKVLVPLLRDASQDKEAMIFPNPGALRKYLSDHPDADRSNHTVDPKWKPKHPHKEEPGWEKDEEQWTAKLTKFVGEAKGAKTEIVEAVKKAPAEVHQIVLSGEHRSKFLSGVADKIKAAPRALAERIKQAAKKEVHEMVHAVKALPKLLKVPPGPFSVQDQHAFYAAGAYVASAALAMVPPGTALMAAGMFGKSFAMHVGIKAVHELLDVGFIHFEWAETVFKVIEHATKLAKEDDKDDKKPDDDVANTALLEGLARIIQGILDKGMTEADMKKIMAGYKDDFSDVD